MKIPSTKKPPETGTGPEVPPGEVEGTGLKERGSDMQSQAGAAYNEESPGRAQAGGKLQEQFLGLALTQLLRPAGELSEDKSGTPLHVSCILPRVQAAGASPIPLDRWI